MGPGYITNMWTLFSTLLVCCSSYGYGQLQQFADDGQPESISAIEGTSVRLRCRVEYVRGRVQWTKDGFVLGYDRSIPSYPRYSMVGSEQLGEYDLLISNIQLMDDAEYECQVGQTPSAKGLRSRVATVNVLIPPVQPVVVGGPVVKVVAGQPSNITCHAYNGKPAAEISFITGDEVIGASHYETIQKDASKLIDATGVLTVVAKKSDQGHHYACRANSSAVLAPRSTPFSLEVLYAPEVTVTVVPNKNMREYDSVQFSCSADANPSDITWQWYRGDDLIEGATRRLLDISAITRDYHNQDITCQATNAVSPTRLPYRLSILYGPQFTQDVEHVAVDVGDGATLTCHVASNPAPAIVWARKGDTRILSSSKTLTLAEVTPADFGTYTCKASTVGFPDVQMDVHLLQKGPPKILSEREQTARFGDVGVLVCDTRSIPKPSFVWTKQGRVINFDHQDRYSMREEDHAFGRRSVVEILSVQDKDFTEYNCTVDNGYGTDSLLIEFSRRDVVALAYILAGVLAGVLLLIILGIIIYFYQRRRRQLSSDDSSQGSDANLKKKSLDAPDIKVEYKSDTWRPELDQRFFRYSADYDELKYPPLEQRANNNLIGRDFTDTYNYGYDPRDARSDYGTYPGLPRPEVYSTFPRRMDPFIRHPHSTGPPSVYSDVYGTHRPVAGRPRYAASDFGTVPPTLTLQPARPASRLSTNV